MNLMTLFFSVFAIAAPDSFLERFHEDPASVYNEIPAKTGHVKSSFQLTDVITENFREMKSENRSLICGENCTSSRNKTSENYLSGIGDFLGGQEAYLNIFSMHRVGLTEGKVAELPWAGSYWPLYKGGLAYRYDDPRIVRRTSTDFKKNKRRNKFPPRIRRDKHIARLAPSEKYDFLMGDDAFTLTKHQWDRGQWYYDYEGRNRVLPWQGYCHGWAVAALNEPRPRRSVTVTAASGRKVTFKPSDIKGLASMLWGNLKFDMHFEGSKCESRRPRVDGTGRIVDPSCFDVNPALFHTVLANLVGYQKRGFVFDAHWDFEIWNHPIRDYSYSYFNPETKKETTNIDDAVIAIEDFQRDPWSIHRDPGTKKVVGIKLKLGYVNLGGASTATTNSSRQDGRKGVTYYYDLELDEEGRILGGEWYQKAHPDMMWVNKADSSPVARGEEDFELLSTWNSRNQAPPASWRSKARSTSYQGDPMRAVVDKLLEWSK